MTHFHPSFCIPLRPLRHLCVLCVQDFRAFKHAQRMNQDYFASPQGMSFHNCRNPASASFSSASYRAGGR